MYFEVKDLMAQLMLKRKNLSDFVIQSNDVAYWSLDDVEVGSLIQKSTDIYCDHSLKGSATKQNVAVIATTFEGIEIVEEINNIKMRLKDLLTSHGNRNKNKKTLLEVSRDMESETLGREIVRAVGESEVSLLQLYRLYPCFKKEVEHVSYTWVRSNRSMKKIAYSECLDLICSKVRSEDNKVTYIDIIKRRPESLLIVKPVSEHLKANIKFKDGNRKSIMAHSPIFIPLTPSGLPKIKWCGDIDSFSERIIRSDKKISDTPAIPELNIYFSE